MNIRSTRAFILGIVVGMAVAGVGAAPGFYRYDQQRDATMAAIRAERDDCIAKLNHASKRIAAYESGWTFVYDHAERPEIQMLHGLAQIGLGAAVPGEVAPRWAIRGHVSVMVMGEPKGAQFVYYDNATRKFGTPRTPFPYQPDAVE